MNFFPNYPGVPNMMPNNMIDNGMDYMNNIFNKFNEFENINNKLEQIITRL